MSVKIRPVEKKDWKFILHLRNLEDIRLAFHDSSIINDETHLKYMQKMEAKPNFFQWIITYNKKDVGYIKIDGLVFGSMLLNEYRGEGIGKQAYALVFKEAKKLGLTKLTAQVKMDRETSIEFEMKTGWIKKEIIYKNNKPYAYSLEKPL